MSRRGRSVVSTGSRARFADRRRAWRRSRWLAVLAVGVAALTLAGATWAVRSSDLLLLRTVRVEGVGEGDAQRLRGGLADAVVAAAQAPVGLQLVRVDTTAVTERVADVSDVDAVEVTRSWPHTLTVHVTLRDPLAAVRWGGGWRFVDEEGAVFGGAEEAPEGLPVVAAGTGDQDRAARVAAVAVLASLPDSLRGQVAEVEARGPADVRLRLRPEGGDRTVEVVWGSPDAGSRKAEVLAALLGVTEGSRIDVSAPDRPAVVS